MKNQPSLLGIHQLQNLIRVGKTQGELITMGHNQFRVQAAFDMETTGTLPPSSYRFSGQPYATSSQRESARSIAAVRTQLEKVALDQRQLAIDIDRRLTRSQRTTRSLIRFANQGRRIVRK